MLDKFKEFLKGIDVKALLDKLIAKLPVELQDKLKNARKAIVAGIGSLLTVLTLVGKFSKILPPNVQKALVTVITALTAALVYLTPNEEIGALAA